jgi:hypothetical protein
MANSNLGVTLPLGPELTLLPIARLERIALVVMRAVLGYADEC